MLSPEHLPTSRVWQSKCRQTTLSMLRLQVQVSTSKIPPHYREESPIKEIAIHQAPASEQRGRKRVQRPRLRVWQDREAPKRHEVARLI